MLTLRGLTLTAAAPRIIVPLFARSLDALRPLAAAAQADPAAELVELRLDPLPAADHTAALALVRSLTDKPLIVTIRTRAEGGELALTPDAYAACCRALLACGGVDVLDIEWRACGPHRDALRSAARAAGARGGTTLHGKGTGEKDPKFYNITLAEEKEVVLIVASAEQKSEIMASVIQKAGPDTEAGTIVFSLPTTEVAGFGILEAN